MARWLSLAQHGLGLDRAVIFTVLARAWTSGSGLITVFLIARFLSPAEQGYYYTYTSLIALQMVFELGFSLVVMQLASHERAHLSIEPDGAVKGDRVLATLNSHCRVGVYVLQTIQPVLERWLKSYAVR